MTSGPSLVDVSRNDRFVSREDTYGPATTFTVAYITRSSVFGPDHNGTPTGTRQTTTHVHHYRGEHMTPAATEQTD